MDKPVHRLFAGRVWERVRPVLRSLFILWLVLVVIVGLIQRRLMYFPSTAAALPVSQYAFLMNWYPDAVDVEFTSSGSQTVRGWYLCQDAETTDTRPLVVLLHGNAGNRAGRAPWYQLLRELGCDVLAIDYQGYGDSTGKPSQAAVENDSVAAWQYAIDSLGIRPENMIVLGISLGGAAAVHVASSQSQAPPAGLITVASFGSMVDVAASAYPWMPVRALLLDRYPSAEKIATVNSPFIHLHGDSDQVVNQEFGKQLFESAPEQSSSGIAKRWVSLDGANHNDILLVSEEVVRRELAGFLQSVAAGGTER